MSNQLATLEQHRKYYIQPESTAMHFDEVSAVIYSTIRDDGKISACAFSGKRGKPDFRYLFKNQEQLQKHITGYISGLQSRKDVMDARKNERKQFVTSLKVGDILVSSWGYEQTNVDFYQVLELKNNSIVIQEISGKAVEHDSRGMCGTCIAVKDSFVGEPMKKKVGVHNYVRLTSYSSASLWSGKPQYNSWYG